MQRWVRQSCPPGSYNVLGGRGGETEVTYSVLPSKSGPVVTYASCPLPWPPLAMLAFYFIPSIIPYVFCLTNTSILLIMS